MFIFFVLQYLGLFFDNCETVCRVTVAWNCSVFHNIDVSLSLVFAYVLQSPAQQPP